MLELPTLEDDNLITPVVGDWAEEKYRLFQCYAELFTTSMKGKWQHLVYIDLFAGPGRARIRGTRRIIPAPPLLALELRYPFTRYIFSEFNEAKLDTLRQRVSKLRSTVDAHFVLGDTNANIDRIVILPGAIQKRARINLLLPDPYRLADWRLSQMLRSKCRRVDFLV